MFGTYIVGSLCDACSALKTNGSHFKVCALSGSTACVWYEGCSVSVEEGGRFKLNLLQPPLVEREKYGAGVSEPPPIDRRPGARWMQAGRPSANNCIEAWLPVV